MRRITGGNAARTLHDGDDDGGGGGKSVYRVRDRSKIQIVAKGVGTVAGAAGKSGDAGTNAQFIRRRARHKI